MFLLVLKKKRLYGTDLLPQTCRGKNRGKATSGGSSWANEVDNQSSVPATEAGETNDVSGSSKTADSSESETVVSSLQDRIKWLELHVVKKVDLCFLFWHSHFNPFYFLLSLFFIIQYFANFCDM